MTIAFTGGGTLGSVIPLLAVQEELQGSDVLWFITKTGPEKKFIPKSAEAISLPEYRLRRFFSIANITNIPNLFRAYTTAKKILKAKNVSCVMTAGSFISVPVCYAAHRLGIPIVVLQLDLRVGLANSIIARFAARIATATHETVRSFLPKTTTTIGIPVSSSWIATAQSKNIFSPFPTILFLGGGTGSEWINRFVATHLSDLCSLANIIHIQGNTERSRTIDSPKNTRGWYKQMLSADRTAMAQAYKDANIVCCRAGMGTIAELAALGKASICIPMPNSHQERNAQFLFDNNASSIAHQNEGFLVLVEKIKKLIGDAALQKKLQENVQDLFPAESSKKAAQLLVSEAYGR